MKKILLGLMILCATVSANAGVYVQGGMGIGIDSDRSISAAVGYEFDFLVKPRAEIEYLYTRAHYDGHKSDLNAAFANAYLTIPFVPLVDPYVGAGIGRARLNHDDSAVAQGIAGLEFELPVLPLSIGAEYRYLKLFDKTNSSKKYDDNLFLVKLKYAF